MEIQVEHPDAEYRRRMSNQWIKTLCVIGGGFVWAGIYSLSLGLISGGLAILTMAVLKRVKYREPSLAELPVEERVVLAKVMQLYQAGIDATKPCRWWKDDSGIKSNLKGLGIKLKEASNKHIRFIEGEHEWYIGLNMASVLVEGLTIDVPYSNSLRRILNHLGELAEVEKKKLALSKLIIAQEEHFSAEEITSAERMVAIDDYQREEALNA